MATHHSAVGTAAYTDMLRLLQEEAVSDLRGSPVLKRLRGKAYWYDHYRVGADTVDRYLGEDEPALRARLAQHAALSAGRKAREAERARLARVLRAEGYLAADAQTGKVVAALAKAGVFRLGGTLVGTHAFRCYEAEIGVRMRFDETAMTDDLDVASFRRLSLVLEDRTDPPVSDVLAHLRFEPVPTLDRRTAWRWQQSDSGALVEFLTPSFDDREDLKEIPSFGVRAQSLHFLNYLIASPIKAALLYRQGVLVQIPRPERFAIHKLIVADRRKDGPDRGKAAKDRRQAEVLIGILAEERPHDLAEAYQAALEKGPAWRTRIQATLARLPEARNILDSLPA